MNEGQSAASAPVEPLEPRTSLEGRWELALHGVGGNNVYMLLDISPGETDLTVTPVGQSPREWTLVESNINDNNVRLRFTDPSEHTIVFEGTFAGGEVRGSIDSGASGLDLATLRPSARQELTPDDFEEHSPEYARLGEIRQDSQAVANVLKLAREFSTRPMGFQLYGQLVNAAQQQSIDGVEVPALIDEYLKAAAHWGDRVTRVAHLDVAFLLALRSQQHDEAIRHLDRAEQGWGDNVPRPLQDKLALTRGLILVDREQSRDQGIEILRKAHQTNPYNLLATSRLAQIYELEGRLEDALAMHAEIVALPSVPGDRKKLDELWAQLGRDPEDLEAHLDAVYEKLLSHFSAGDEPAAPALDGQQVVLGELFTGATCPPCVAADVATGALEHLYPQSRLIMLRYHQHIPAPDPMTVPDGELRRDYYSVRGTPMVYFNGQQIQGVGGYFFNAPVVYASLRQLVAPLLEQTTELRIDLAADADAAGENIHIRAAVSGAQEYPENWRLRLCLAEEAIHYPAPNGIRIHDMVVRMMPGTANGVVAEKGSLSYEADVPMNDILAAVEEGAKAAEARSRGQLPPLPVEINRLQLVAFVQDDDTFEVLQAASTPVNGLPETALSKSNAAGRPTDASPK